MAKVFDSKDYEELEFSCEECGWKGIGSDAKLIDFYNVSDVKELRCPNCDSIIATLKSNS